MPQTMRGTTNTAANTQSPVDVGIVVALRDELRDLLDLAGSYTPHSVGGVDGFIFERGSYRCIAVLVGSMGESAATSVTERLIREQDPASVVVIGIAAGVHADLRVGDVYVPQQAVQYIEGAKAEATASGGFTIAPGAPSFRPNFDLHTKTSNIEFNLAEIYKKWVEDGRADLEALVSKARARKKLVKNSLVREAPRLLADAHIATGPVVGAAAAFSAWIRSHDRNAKALDMETAAVLRAAQSRPDPTRTLAIRGISDYGDDRKQELDLLGDGALRRYAMRNAVRLLFAMLDAGAWLREREAQNPSVSQAPIPAPAPSEAATQLAHDHVSISRLPAPMGSTFLGRDEELERLEACWSERDTRVVSLIAMGGAGKSALVDAWLKQMQKAGWRGAERVYGWSFYSQGSSEMGSGDTFFAEALSWFGHTGEIPVPAWDRGELLARLVKKQKTLLILDGLEPLQAPPGPEAGKLRDPGVAALVRELAAGGNGLAVISTRIAVADLASSERDGGSATRIELEELSPEDGAKLLAELKVKGETAELEEASREMKGHALALTLLGSYLADACHGDIRRRKEIGPLENDVTGGEHAKHVMAAYARWLGDGPEVAVLRLLGLFDRPAEEGCLRALRAKPAIPKLTKKLVALSDVQWAQTVSKLRRAHLVAEVVDRDPGGIDAHPLVREYFGTRLREEASKAWRAGHGRLFEHLQKVAPEFPETTAEMAPLYAAVVHGCHAGRRQEAVDEVLWERVNRCAKFFNTRKLGAFGAELGMFAAFFDPPWSRVAPGLTKPFEAFVLGNAGSALRALGRLDEAVKPMQLGLENYLAQEMWRHAARVAGNLSELHLARGALRVAMDVAKQSIELADQSGDSSSRVVMLTTLADALHQAGSLDEARVLFEKAEAMQKELEPKYPLLYSLRGFQYCDLLLGLGLIGDVSKRARQMFDWRVQDDPLLDLALDHLTLGRASVAEALRDPTGDITLAQKELDEAVTRLRQAGYQEVLTRGLLERAELHIAARDFPAAERDLTEALTLATRCGLRLFEADAHLGFARLHLAWGDSTAARHHFALAKALVERTGYHRRDPELAAVEEALLPATSP